MDFAWARGEVSPSASKASRSTNAKSGKHTNPLTVTLNMFQKLYRYAMPVLKTSRFRHLFRFVAFSAYPLCGLKRRPQRLLSVVESPFAEPVEATTLCKQIPFDRHRERHFPCYTATRSLSPSKRCLFANKSLRQAQGADSFCYVKTPFAEPVEATIFFPFYHIMKAIPAKIKIKLP